MTKYDSGDEMRSRIRDTFSENIANQAELLNYFTKNPSNLRTRKEREEMMSEGLTNDEGLITVTKTGLPASQEIIDKVMKRVDERMLTEGNPEMRENNFNYRGGKLLPIAEVKN
tara:strand:- start:68 stop:409 length:342 start_codon:yes stop_codon:yes gene_type:complete